MGCTLIVVTHNQFVAARADRLLRLDGGRLVDVPDVTDVPVEEVR
jgi:predicted ABC-type transport system involved in lysophospholipase L1 biosynthesis ATPase subunit